MISIVKGIYEKWPTIVTNLTHEDMVNVDARKLSIYELAEAHKFSFVAKYNDSRAVKTPKRRKRKAAPAYTTADVKRAVAAIVNTGALQGFNFESEQIALLGEDIKTEMLAL